MEGDNAYTQGSDKQVAAVIYRFLTETEPCQACLREVYNTAF